MTKIASVITAAAILCGGSINSPQLLQLSGVGNAPEIEPYGIDLVADLPGVGANLQDHLEVYVQYRSLQPVSMQPALQKWRRPWIGHVRRGTQAQTGENGDGQCSDGLFHC